MRARLCLLAACALLLLPASTHFQTPLPTVVLPHALPAMSGELARFTEVVFHIGQNYRLAAGSAERFGFGRREISTKIVVSEEKDGTLHNVEVLVLDGSTYLMLTVKKSPEVGSSRAIFGFRTSPSGEFIKGIQKTGPDTFKELTSDEGSKLFVAEKTFWLDWLAKHPNGIDKTAKP